MKFLCTVLSVCSESIKFSSEELSEIKRISTGNLRLLGFKPLSCLKDYHNLRPSTFLFPSDEVLSSLVLLQCKGHFLVAIFWSIFLSNRLPNRMSRILCLPVVVVLTCSKTEIYRQSYFLVVYSSKLISRRT